MNYVFNLGKSAQRLAAQVLPAATLAVVLVSPAAAQPAAQACGLEPSAPENLRCHGRAGPTDGFHFEAHWQNVAGYAGQPFEVTLDHSCNLFVASKDSNQILKYNAEGQQVAAWTMAARQDGAGGVAAVAVAPDGTEDIAPRQCNLARVPSGRAPRRGCDPALGQR